MIGVVVKAMLLCWCYGDGHAVVVGVVVKAMLLWLVLW